MEHHTITLISKIIIKKNPLNDKINFYLNLQNEQKEIKNNNKLLGLLQFALFLTEHPLHYTLILPLSGSTGSPQQPTALPIWQTENKKK